MDGVGLGSRAIIYIQVGIVNGSRRLESVQIATVRSYTPKETVHFGVEDSVKMKIAE